MKPLTTSTINGRLKDDSFNVISNTLSKILGSMGRIHQYPIISPDASLHDQESKPLYRSLESKQSVPRLDSSVECLQDGGDAWIVIDFLGHEAVA